MAASRFNRFVPGRSTTVFIVAGRDTEPTGTLWNYLLHLLGIVISFLGCTSCSVDAIRLGRLCAGKDTSLKRMNSENCLVTQSFLLSFVISFLLSFLLSFFLSFFFSFLSLSQRFRLTDNNENYK